MNTSLTPVQQQQKNWDKVDVSDLDNTLAKTTSPILKSFDISFFSQKSRKQTLLISNTDEQNFVPSKKGWLSFDLNDIFYVFNAEVFATGYDGDFEIEFSYVDPFSETSKIITAKYSGNSFRIPINRFIRGFGLKAPPRFFTQPQITSVTVNGFEPSQLIDVVNSFNQIENLKEKIWADSQVFVKQAETADKKLLEFEEKNQSLLDEKEGILTETSSFTKALELIKSENQNRQIELERQDVQSKALQNFISQLDDQIEKKTEERKILNAEVSSSTSKLSELQRDIHLFPSEISGYVKQGANNINLYLLGMIIPFLTIIAVTGRLFWNAESILSAFIEHRETPIVDYLISRIPYAVISAAVLGVCYYVLRILFAEIININRRKQELYKISIIATDVSFASLRGLNLEAEETYNLRTETKMELLKEHLRQNISQDYVYSPSANLLTKILSRAQKPKLDEENEVDSSQKTQ